MNYSTLQKLKSMKKTIPFLLLSFLVTVQLFAQQVTFKVQGIPRADLSNKMLQKASSPLHLNTASGDDMYDYSTFSPDSVKFWVGSGDNRATLVIDWYDEKGSKTALVWGYCWHKDSVRTGFDMVRAIAQADKRFLFLTHHTGPMGNTIAGFGYDLNNNGNQALLFENDTENPFYPVNGTITTTAYNYDSWTNTDPADHWRSGWTTGYWSYQVKEAGDDEFTYSGLGASSRVLENGSCDGWAYMDFASGGMSGSLPRMPFVYVSQTLVEEPQEKVDYTQGIFFINEDWYGHNNSTVNFLDKNNQWHYRVYQKENPGKELGCSSPFGAIYGNKLFIVSKQDKDPGAEITGSRLAVCDAQTMQSLAEFTQIGDADGRSFLGVDEHKGYIGTSNGIYLFDMDKLTIGNKLKGTENESGSLYSGQIGNMVRAGDKVFAVNQQKGIMVIDVQKDSVQTIISAPKDGSKQRGFGSIVQSKDGNLWLSVATNTSGNGNAEEYILKLNPYTLDTMRVQLPAGISIPNSWYAWTADGFCASAKNNTLYWKNNGGWFSSTKIYEYDIDKQTTRTVIDFSTYEPTENWGIYGAGFRIDPLTDELYVSLFKSFGEPIYKAVKVNPEDGMVTASYPMEDNYWFPAMPVFTDNYAPVVSDELSDLTVDSTIQICLSDKVSDEDNLDAAIVKSIVSVSNPSILTAAIQNDSLIIAPVAGKSGTAVIEIQFNSNGRVVTKSIEVEVPVATGMENIESSKAKVYPTLTNGRLTIVQEDKIAPVQLFSSSGQLLQTIHLNALNSSIDISAYQSGLYLVKVGKQVVKVVKQ